MNPNDLTELAIYNAEKARGLMHTEPWRERMAQFQEEFNRELAAKSRLKLVPTKEE